MILTVTLNAAIDKTLRVANLQIGMRHRSAPGLVQAGGKGVNVARALRRLGEPVIATGLAGGTTGALIMEELGQAGIVNDFVRIADDSRTSTLVIDPTGDGRPTEIVEYGPEVLPEELAALGEHLAYLMRGVDTIVLAGSLPRRVPEEWYAGVVREARKHKLFTVLDSEGEPLRLGVAGEPDLVVPNQAEAEELVGFEFQTEHDDDEGLSAIVEMGARSVVITRETGCIALLREGGRMRRFTVAVAPLEPVSAVGAGDALLAGLLSARRAEKPLEEALRYAVACGSAATQAMGAGVLDPKEAARLVSTVTVEELERA
jgi:1-phosphofructokinase family hexose kinase